jgi:hypothetical protein
MSRGDWAVWLAQMLPRRVVFACLLRAIGHSVELDRHRGLSRITANDLICEWREVTNGEEREKR